MAEYDYEELLSILGMIHTEPAFTNIKEYIQSNRSRFTPEQYDTLKDLISKRESYFNPTQCNRIKEIRLYYKDENGHEFSTAYSGGKAYALCREAKDAGMTLPEYIAFLTSNTNNFVAWTMDASGGSYVGIRRASYEERYSRENPVRYTGRVLRRNIREAEREDEEEHKAIDVQLNIADLINKLRADMQELIQESARENVAQIERLRQEINGLQSRIEASQGIAEPEKKEKTITRVLDSSQYRYFLSNAYKIGLAVKYQQIARGQYQVSITVSNADDEKKALTFIGEAEEHEREASPSGKTHLEGYDQILDILCSVYTKESGMPCGLSRTGALSTLADHLLEYAASQGVDWQALYDIGSIDLFAKRGQIYTREQADEAFNNIISLIHGKNMARRMEEQVEGETCSDEAIMSHILNYDAIVLFRRNYPNVDDPTLNEMQEDAVNGLKLCGYYPDRLNEAERIASSEFESYGTTFNDQVSALVDQLVRKYGGITG